MPRKPVIGVLALQGAVDLHKAHIEAAGGEFRAIKTAEQIDAVDAYILPGGESTTMLKLIETFSLWDILARNFASKPVWGICAGSILMAQDVWVDETRTKRQTSFGLMPVEIVRNGYGRQLDSHHAVIAGYEVSFIRAPIVSKMTDAVEVLAKEGDIPVWLKFGKHRLSTFHAELTRDYPSPMHVDFIRGLQPAA
jgi:5'-phosphate synthase pdxT subunit